jgi:hypothetical protein
MVTFLGRFHSEVRDTLPGLQQFDANSAIPWYCLGLALLEAEYDIETG